MEMLESFSGAGFIPTNKGNRMGNFMNCRPILFSDSMVRALLEGRKTQTRRIVKNPDDGVSTCIAKNDAWPLLIKSKQGRWIDRPCPYGKSGDLLWVRESFWQHRDEKEIIRGADCVVTHRFASFCGWKKKPSIHMPRAASRITLELTDVSVEHLHDITPQDVLKEGVTSPEAGFARLGEGTQMMQFASLWEEINGTGAWDKNPFVWVLKFNVHPINIDSYLEKLTTETRELRS